MPPRSNRRLYAAAAVAGVVPAFILLAAMFSDPRPGASFVREMGERAAVVALIYGILGGALGFAKPAGSWRWGLALSVPGLAWLALLLPLFLSALVSGNRGPEGSPVTDFLVWLAFLAATLGASAGMAAVLAWLRRRLARGVAAAG